MSEGFNDGLHGAGAAVFRLIIHEQIGRCFICRGLLHERDRFFPHVRLHESVLGLIAFDRLLMGQSQRGQESKDGKWCGKYSRQSLMLFGQRRHGSPVTVDMGDAVSLRDVPIARTQDGGIPRLDGVSRAGRQLFSESVGLVEKPGWFQPSALKLKEEGAELWGPALPGTVAERDRERRRRQEIADRTCRPS